MLLLLKCPFGQFKKHFDLVLLVFYVNYDFNFVERSNRVVFFFVQFDMIKIYLLHRQLNYKRHLKIFSEFKHSFYGIILLVRLLTLPFSLWQCSIKQHRIENISSGIRDLFWNHLYFEWKVIVHEMAKQMLTPKMKTEKYGQQTFVCFFHLF